FNIVEATMNKIVSWPSLLAGIAFLLLNALPAHAQNLRSWVAHGGNDAALCTSTFPCATFAVALTQTIPGGTIGCLDGGAFGAVTITKSVTIACSGTVGAIVPGGGFGVTINALATDTVVLRGLTIDGLGAQIGVAANSVGVLRIDHCKISGFKMGTATGIH